MTVSREVTRGPPRGHPVSSLLVVSCCSHDRSSVDAPRGPRCAGSTAYTQYTVRLLCSMCLVLVRCISYIVHRTYKYKVHRTCTYLYVTAIVPQYTHTTGSYTRTRYKVHRTSYLYDVQPLLLEFAASVFTRYKYIVQVHRTHMYT